MSESESLQPERRLDQPLQFKSGQRMKNRFMLAAKKKISAKCSLFSKVSAAL